MNDLITCHDLNLWYHDFHALKDINTFVKHNTVTALIGPSGCGKSTFLRCLNRLNEEILGTRVEGKIVFDGKNIYDHDADPVLVRKDIGMVFQQPNPFPAMTVLENVAVGLKLSGVKKKKDLMEQVEKSLIQAALWDEVKDILNRNAMGLSGGQQQRLCIARAIATNPKVVLMDEPTSALDPVATAKIEELMMRLKDDFTVVVVTHNMQQAMRVSDYTNFFVLGELLETSETSAFFHNPQHEQSQRYLSGQFG
jgi:phosphate transport system ATP-binding protein